jgi:hypothetical protein
LVSQLRKDLLLCSSYLPLGVPNGLYLQAIIPPLENCYFDVPLADVAKKKLLGRIHDVLIMVNHNLVRVDFLVLDIECNASCPIILEDLFLELLVLLLI